MVNIAKQMKGLLGRHHDWKKFVAAAGRVKPVQPSPISSTRLIETSDFGSNPGNLRMFSYLPAEMAEHPALVVVRCPIHQDVGLVDGSAQMLDATAQVVQRDGEWVIMRTPQKDAP